MGYDAFCFDMDGVLLRGRHTDPAVYETAADRVLADRGVRDPPEALRAAVADPDSIPAFRSAVAEHDLAPERVWAARERAASEIEGEHIAAGRREPYPDVDALHDLDASIGVVSNNRHATVEVAVEHLGLDVAAAVGRDPTLDGYGRLKPDPHYLDRALAAVGAERALYVGDRYTDVAAAHAAGAEAALLERPELDPGEGPDPEHVVEGLDEVVDLRPRA
jgi:HAD superfamily hydrolase (TIGR01549 family)